MKYFKIIKYIIITTLIILIIDYIRLNISYNLNKKNYQETFNIQGNKNKYIPQGLTYSSKYNIVLQTSYNSNNKVSMLYIIDYNNNKLIKELKLKNSNNKNNYNHVGGITTNNDIVWITNNYEVNEYNLNEIINTNKDYIKANSTIKLPNRGDFTCYHNNILWIGDFYLKPFYNVPNNNPLMLGYILKENINYNEPNYIVSLPKMIQGLAITDNNKFIFTSSFTNLINSNLSMYNNILDTKHTYYKLNNKKIPYYKFTNNNLINNIKLPPMAEGLFYKDNYLYILFENSSDNYFYAIPKIKKVIKYKY